MLYLMKDSVVRSLGHASHECQLRHAIATEDTKLIMHCNKIQGNVALGSGEERNAAVKGISAGVWKKPLYLKEGKVLQSARASS